MTSLPGLKKSARCHLYSWINETFFIYIILLTIFLFSSDFEYFFIGGYRDPPVATLMATDPNLVPDRCYKALTCYIIHHGQCIKLVQNSESKFLFELRNIQIYLIISLRNMLNHTLNNLLKPFHWLFLFTEKGFFLVAVEVNFSGNWIWIILYKIK